MTPAEFELAHEQRIQSLTVAYAPYCRRDPEWEARRAAIREAFKERRKELSAARRLERHSKPPVPFVSVRKPSPRQLKRREYFRQRHLKTYVHRGRPPRHPVLRSDGQQFPSIVAAARACGARTHSVIHKALGCGCAAYGYHWTSLRSSQRSAAA
jgi:hypothetical protein